jgi:hypothetical protein
MRPKPKDEELPKEEPKHEKDDGPLTEQQVEQIIESAPKPKEPSIVQSYLTKPGVFFKWRPAPKQETAPAEEPKVEEVKVEEPKVEPVIEQPKVEPIIEPPKVEELVIVAKEPDPIIETPVPTVDTAEVKVDQPIILLSPTPVGPKVEKPAEDDLELEKKRVATDDEDRVILVEDEKTRYINQLKQLEKDRMKSWKDSNPNDTIKQQLKLRNMGLIDRLPWQVDELEKIRAQENELRED